MNKPCNIECGNEPDFYCKTCGYRNVDYPMPGAVEAFEPWTQQDFENADLKADQMLEWLNENP